MPPGVHGVEVLEARHVEKQAQAIAHEAIDHAQARKEEGHDPLGIGG